MAQHILHVGYPKAASTFLQAWFDQHPQLRYAAGGIGGFHNVYELSRPLGASPKYYVTSDEALSTPTTSVDKAALQGHGGAEPLQLAPIKRTQADVCDLLRGLFPGSLVIIVTRGFKGMIMSGYSQYVRGGGLMHLGDMCASLGAFLEGDDYHFYDFDYFVSLYAAAFGEENLIVLPYELLRDDQTRFISVLEERLGLAHHDVELEPVNRSLSPAEMYWYPVISQVVSKVLMRMGSSHHERYYESYSKRVMNNRLRLLIKVLQAIFPGRGITEHHLPTGVLELCRGRASRLQTDVLYGPYAAEYLWDDE